MPAEKGFAFVTYLRECAGSDAAFNAWLTRYFTDNAFKSIGTVDMLDSYFTSFPHLRGDWSREGWAAEDAAAAPGYWAAGMPVPADLEARGVLPAWDPESPGTGGKRGLAYRPGYEISRWLHAPGWPPFYPSLASTAAPLTGPAEALSARWVAATLAGPEGDADALASIGAASAPELRSWPTYQTLHFLDTLTSGVVSAASEAQFDGLLPALDGAYGFGAHNNAEVRLRWAQLVGAAAWAPGFASIESFLASLGKQKYQLPSFRALCNAPEGSRVSSARRSDARDAAKRIFLAVRASLHVNVRTFAARILAGAGVTGLE